MCKKIVMTDESDEPSNLEAITGNLVTSVTATAVAAFAATPLAALLPLLTNSLASGRHKNRVEAALKEINDTLKEHQENIKNLSDSQYKIINESILTLLQTTEKEKITYLKQAVKNNVQKETVNISHASSISRILRDISAEEIIFIINNFRYKRIVFDRGPRDHTQLQVERRSDEALLVSGLMSMGLIVPAPDTWEDTGCYEFSKIVAKLLVVIGT